MTMEPSCSDCKIELIERKWTQLLLKWINKCGSTYKVKKLNPKSLADIMAKYNRDVCANDIDRAMLCTDDVEPFIKYKYPILRLHYLSEETDLPKRLYITTSMILYHCCMSSRTGAVDGDIFRELTKYEQELILKFCENLCEMEATVNNVERAIRDAFENVGGIEPSDQMSTISSDTVAQASSDSTTKGSMTTLPSNSTLVQEPAKLTTLKFNSSITVLPSFMTETSTYSDLMTDKKESYVDSDEINIYAFENTTDKIKIGSTKPTREIQLSENESPSSDEHALSKHKITDKMYSEIKENETIIKQDNGQDNASDKDKTSHCLSDCACTRCSATGPCCGDRGSKLGICNPDEKKFFDL